MVGCDSALGDYSGDQLAASLALYNNKSKRKRESLALALALEYDARTFIAALW